MSQILNLYKSLLSARASNKGRFIDEVFERDIYKPGLPQLTIIDLGAYQGEFAFYCLNFAKKVYAVEPDPRPYKIMRRRVKKYGLRDIIKTFRIAISGKSGDRPFHTSGFGGSTLQPEGTGGGEIQVKTLSLNDFIIKYKIENVDILKIDVESSEKEIFDAPDFPHAAEIIKTIVGEVHQGIDSIKGRLESLGFEVKTYQTCFTAIK